MTIVAARLPLRSARSFPVPAPARPEPARSLRRARRPPVGRGDRHRRARRPRQHSGITIETVLVAVLGGVRRHRRHRPLHRIPSGDVLVNVIGGGVFILIGSALTMIGGIGAVRFPDVDSRMHAVAKAPTLGLVLVAICAAFTIRTSLAICAWCSSWCCSCSVRRWGARHQPGDAPPPRRRPRRHRRPRPRPPRLTLR